MCNVLEPFNHGFPEAAWNAAKGEARAILIATAKKRGMITYSNLAKQITSINLTAHDVRLYRLAGELSVEEDAAGRGMLSALALMVCVIAPSSR